MLIALVIVGLFVVGWQLGHGVVGASLFIPWPAAVLAGVTAVLGFVAYLWAPKKILFGLALASYLLLAITTGTVIFLTGMENSPFLALWMLITIFSALFGYWGLAPVFLAANGTLIYQLTLVVGLSKSELILFLLACELPLVISYLVWHTRRNHETAKDRAFSALAQELNQVANKSEIVINAIGDGVLALDDKGTTQLINPAAQQLLGWSKQDAMGLDYHALMKLSNPNGKALTNEADPIQHVLKTSQSIVNNDLMLTTESGKQMMLSLLISPISTTGRSGVIVVFRDITKQKAEEREQVEFISTASHEMRTPVAAIEGYLGLALNPNTAAIDDKARLYLQKAHESAQHLGRLFQDLLDVSKAEDGRLSNNPAVIDTVAFVRDVTTAMEPKAREKGLFLYFKPGEAANTQGDVNRKLTPVFYTDVDNDHLREILGNLIDNAIKYTKQGSVTVDIAGDAEHVLISVSDTGIGIPPEDLPHLFQKFYRVDNTATREIGGTGLGLYLCRRLAETIHGRLWAKSEYGKGSTFYLELARMSHEEALNRLEQTSEEPTPIIKTSTPAASIAQTPQTPTPPVVAQAAAILAPNPPAATQPQVAPQSAPVLTVAPVDPMLRPTPPAANRAQLHIPNRSAGTL